MFPSGFYSFSFLVSFSFLFVEATSLLSSRTLFFFFFFFNDRAPPEIYPLPLPAALPISARAAAACLVPPPPPRSSRGPRSRDPPVSAAGLSPRGTPVPSLRRRHTSSRSRPSSGRRSPPDRGSAANRAAAR